MGGASAPVRLRRDRARVPGGIVARSGRLPGSTRSALRHEPKGAAGHGSHRRRSAAGRRRVLAPFGLGRRAPARRRSSANPPRRLRILGPRTRPRRGASGARIRPPRSAPREASRPRQRSARAGELSGPGTISIGRRSVVDPPSRATRRRMSVWGPGGTSGIGNPYVPRFRASGKSGNRAARFGHVPPIEASPEGPSSVPTWIEATPESSRAQPCAQNPGATFWPTRGR